MRKRYSVMLSCREASHMVSRGLDRGLGLGERISLRFHLAICDRCASFKKQMAFLRKAVQRLGSRGV
jgi:hypothetical protein